MMEDTMYTTYTQLLADANTKFFNFAVEGTNDAGAESEIYEIAQTLVEQKGELHFESEGVGPFNYLSQYEIAQIVASMPHLLVLEPEMLWVNPLPWPATAPASYLLPVIYDQLVRDLQDAWENMKSDPDYVQVDR